MLRAILFDLGDTLIDFSPMDTRAVFRRAAEQTYHHLAGKSLKLPSLRDYTRGQLRALRWGYLRAKITGREFNSLDRLRDFCESQSLRLSVSELNDLAWNWYQPITEHSSVEAEAPALLAGLVARGLKMAVISNTFVPGSAMDRHLEMFSLLDFFPVRIYSSEVGVRKPARRIFELALSQLGVRGNESMFVGDLVKTDIGGARRAGMVTVLKQPWGTHRARRHADHIIHRLADLAPIIDRIQPGSGSSEPGPLKADAIKPVDQAPKIQASHG